MHLVHIWWMGRPTRERLKRMQDHKRQRMAGSGEQGDGNIEHRT
jgi:hypothetical protein